MAQEYVQISMIGIADAGGGTAKTFANIYHFRRTVTAGSPVKSEIDTAFQTAIGDKVLLAISDQYTQAFNYIRFFDDALDFNEPFTQAGVGAIAADRAPDYVSATVRFKSPVNSRSARGAKRYGPLGESQTLADALAAGSITLFNTVGTAVVAGFTDASGFLWKPVIKSSKFGAQYLVNPVTVVTFPITGFITNTLLGIMKRRKAKRV